MKIYFNRRPVVGPWGGGSKVLMAIVKECVNRNHQVFFEEQIRDNHNFDLMFCLDPKPNQFVDYGTMLNKKRSNPQTKLIQRVGDLGTHGKPEFFEIVKASSAHSDVLIFPSHWAKEYLNPDKTKTCYVIQNAPLKDFLTCKKNRILSKQLSIVSHHWSDNRFKGFEIYKQLDDYCVENNQRFTFVGRKPSTVELKNYIPPQDVQGLVNELPKHDVYVTASKLEAGANHVLEAIALGLPVLYHKDGGSINEYCKDFGLQYSSFEELTFILQNKRDELQKLINEMQYKRSSEDMAAEYVNLFESLI